MKIVLDAVAKGRAQRALPETSTSYETGRATLIMRGREAAFYDGKGMIAGRFFQAIDELSTFTEIDTIGQPDDFQFGRFLRKTLDQRERRAAVDGMRLRLDLLQRHARRAGHPQGEIVRRVG